MPLDPASLQRAALLAHLDQEDAPEPAPSGGGAPTSSSLNPLWYALPAAGQTADALSTLHNLGRGYAESNPVFGGSTGAILASKAAIGAGLPLLMHYFATHGHPTAAKVIGITGGVGGAIPAAINLSQK